MHNLTAYKVRTKPNCVNITGYIPARHEMENWTISNDTLTSYSLTRIRECNPVLDDLVLGKGEHVEEDTRNATGNSVSKNIKISNSEQSSSDV